MSKRLTKFRPVNQIRFPQCEPDLQASCGRGDQEPCVLYCCTDIVAAVQGSRIRRVEGVNSAGNLAFERSVAIYRLTQFWPWVYEYLDQFVDMCATQTGGAHM